jgi:hypothetical protein
VRERRRCPVCGAADAACAIHPVDTAVDDLFQEVAVVGGELKTYEVEVNGNMTTMQLNEDDAKKMGVLPGGGGEGTGDGDQQDESLVTSGKTRGTANKARTTENK